MARFTDIYLLSHLDFVEEIVLGERGLKICENIVLMCFSLSRVIVCDTRKDQDIHYRMTITRMFERIYEGLQF